VFLFLLSFSLLGNLFIGVSPSVKNIQFDRSCLERGFHCFLFGDTRANKSVCPYESLALNLENELGFIAICFSYKRSYDRADQFVLIAD